MGHTEALPPLYPEGREAGSRFPLGGQRCERQRPGLRSWKVMPHLGSYKKKHGRSPPQALSLRRPRERHSSMPAVAEASPRKVTRGAEGLPARVSAPGWALTLLSASGLPEATPKVSLDPDPNHPGLHWSLTGCYKIGLIFSLF